MRNPLATLDAVRLDDPAIDKSKSDLEAYAKTRDIKYLTFIDGQKPVIFKVAQPASAYVVQVLDKLSGTSRLASAFLACVHEVVLPDDQRLLPQKEHMQKSIAGGMMLAHDKWLDQIRAKFGMKTILEMGKVACDLGDMSDEELAGFSWPVG
jgi:hypothetical protein